METENLSQVIESAKNAFHEGDFPKAIREFQFALDAFRDKGDELNTAEMANNLSVALLQDGQKQAALDVVEGTDQVFLKHNDQVKQAMAIGNKAAALDVLKRFEEAEEAYEQCAELLKESGESELRTQVLKSLSAVQLRRGKQLEGLFSMQRGLEGVEKPSLKDRILNWFLKLPFKFLGK